MVGMLEMVGICKNSTATNLVYVGRVYATHGELWGSWVHLILLIFAQEWHNPCGIMWYGTKRNKSMWRGLGLGWPAPLKSSGLARGIVLAGTQIFQTGPTCCFEPISNKHQSHSISPEVFPMCVASPFSYYGHWHIWMVCKSYIGTWNQPLGRAKAEQRHSCRQMFLQFFYFVLFTLCRLPSFPTFFFARPTVTQRGRGVLFPAFTSIKTLIISQSFVRVNAEKTRREGKNDISDIPPISQNLKT